MISLMLTSCIIWIIALGDNMYQVDAKVITSIYNSPPMWGQVNKPARTMLEGISSACKPVCFRVSMDIGIVSSVYNNCTCMQHHHRRNVYDYMKKRHILHPKCSTHYRTLKFRNATTGSTLFRQKVARSCIGGSRTYINQSDYDREEKEFITRR
ncbi:hypothetical protein ANCCAN_00014 [Ancylostoma caninum]|uniref:Uncharacterized protein n=1 Tax=Ancylostoma caninum TaxID=29170 RepID=A0A368HA88_ANCCA|nr:hypothetical protein ANCCAN_00014 [Ancylostoma caninum]